MSSLAIVRYHQRTKDQERCQTQSLTEEIVIKAASEISRVSWLHFATQAISVHLERSVRPYR